MSRNKNTWDQLGETERVKHRGTVLLNKAIAVVLTMSLFYLQCRHLVRVSIFKHSELGISKFVNGVKLS